MWVTALAFSLALLHIGWNGEKPSLLFLGASSLFAAIGAPLGYACAGRRGLKAGIVIGVLLGVALYLAFVMYGLSVIMRI
jgi:hypothetical protein